MKRVFIFLSILIIAIFTTSLIVKSPEQFSYGTYSNVYLKSGESKQESKEMVDKELNHLALSKNSLIVKRIVQPTKSEHEFIYEKYGNYELPKNLTLASNSAAKESSIFLQYRILKGDLTNQDLAKKFRELGYTPVIQEKQSPILTISAFLVSDAVILSLSIFLLSFVGLSIIRNIKDLRKAGIQYISGKRIYQIMFESVLGDVWCIFISIVTSSIFCIIQLKIFNVLQIGLLMLPITAILIYSFVLVFGSFLLSFTYLVGLKNKGLMSVIKGKLPFKRLIGIILFCQLISVLIVGWGCARVPLFYANLKEEDRASEIWGNVKNRVNIGFGLPDVYLGEKEKEEEDKTWYKFIKETTEKEDALLVQNNLLSFISSNKDLGGNTINSYSPEGNTICVTPNYFDLQKININSSLKEEIHHLKRGQFALILPEKLRKSSDKYKRIYEQYLSQYTSENNIPNSNNTLEAESVLGYLPNNQKRFIYNNTSISAKQFLTDPIIIVINATSLGSSSSSVGFWKNMVSNYIFFNDYDKTTLLLKKYNLYPFVSTLSSSQQSFREQQNFYHQQTIILMFSSLLGILASLVLFNSMNLLYFEEFRKSIFIKRISGLKFWEIHFGYLGTQWFIFIIGYAVNVFLTHNVWTSALTLLMFLINSVIVLYYQIVRENKFAVTILKGK